MKRSGTFWPRAMWHGCHKVVERLASRKRSAAVPRQDSATWRRGWMVGAAFLGTTLYVLAEELILTTYYPSPRGIYQELRVGSGRVSTPTGKLHVVQEDPSLLAPPALRVDDQTPPDPTPFVIDNDGKVGIGTASPDTRTDVKLDVAGNIIAGVKTPLLPTDAANKEYVDAAGGGPKIVTASGNAPVLLDCGAGWVVLRCGKGYSNNSVGTALAYAGWGYQGMRSPSPPPTFQCGFGPECVDVCSSNELGTRYANLSVFSGVPAALIAECVKGP